MTIKLTEEQRRELKINILSSFIQLIEGRPGLKDAPEMSKAYRELKEYLQTDEEITKACNDLKQELKEFLKAGTESEIAEAHNSVKAKVKKLNEISEEKDGQNS